MHRPGKIVDVPQPSLPGAPSSRGSRTIGTSSAVNDYKFDSFIKGLKQMLTLTEEKRTSLGVTKDVVCGDFTRSILRASKENVGKLACIEGLMQKVRLLKKSEARASRVKELFKKLWDRGDIIACIMRELLDYDGLEIWIDYESNSVVNMLEEVIGGSGEKRQGDSCRSYVHRSDKRIYVGIKETENSGEDTILGYIADSMAHIVLYRIFKNGGRPYSRVDIDHKRQFQSILHDITERSAEDDFNQWIKWAIGRKATFDQETDLITAVMAIIAEHGMIEGKDILESQIPDLFTFYMERVMPRLNGT